MKIQPDKELIDRVETLMASPSTNWAWAEGGYTAAGRWIVGFGNGASAFIKAATTDLTAKRLREDYYVYAHIEGDYLPAVLGWQDDGARPILALADLSRAHWPPPWEPWQVDKILEALAKVWATPPPPGVLPVDRATQVGWTLVQEDPAPFLSLGLCSESWLRESLPTLVESELNAPIEGDEFTHMDIRSDNLCFADDRVLIVDWDLAARANSLLDIAAWLPSLEAEGGPSPEQVCPEASVFAGLLSGYFAARAGLPPLKNEPMVRRVQTEQLLTSLPWAVRTLGLPPLA